MTYTELQLQYGNGKQLGNKVLFTAYGSVIGYDILNYTYLSTPFEVDEASKVYTTIKPEWHSMDDAYDFLYGAPTAPDFAKAVK